MDGGLLLGLFAVVLLSGCGGMLLPTYEPRDAFGAEPGIYEVRMTVEVLPDGEAVAQRCNHGVPPEDGYGALGCTFTRAEPELIIVPRIQNVNDWQSMCVWGHEAAHVLYGDWHVPTFVE